MKIIAKSKLADGRNLALVETSVISGGRPWGRFAVIRLVAMPAEMAVDAYRTVRNSAIEVLGESAEVDTRYTGPRSNYYARLQRMLEKFNGLAA